MALYRSNVLSSLHKLSGNAWLSIVCLLLLSACASTHAPSAKELALLDNPPHEVKQKQDLLTPLTLDWFKEVELRFLKKGRLLTEKEISMAKSVGVKHPENVRVIILTDFPSPQNKTLRTETKGYGLGNSAEGGRTMGYVIMLKARFKDDRWTLAHELAHVAQQEKMGVKAFVRRFIAEHELMGNRRAPLELDANAVALDFK